MWEGGLRVPMIVAGPGIPKNSQCDHPVAQWDYLPTFHALADSKAPLPNDLDGISIKSVLENGNAGKLPSRDSDSFSISLPITQSQSLLTEEVISN